MRLSKPSLAILICTITLAILLCIPTNSLIPHTISNRENIDPSIPPDEKNPSQHNNKNTITILNHIKAKRSNTHVKEKKDFSSAGILSYNQNTRVSQYDGYDTYPSIAIHNQKNVLVAYTHRGVTDDIYIQRSFDGGITWSEVFYSPGPKELNYPFSTSNQTNPDLTITPSGYGFCVFKSDDNTSRVYMLEFPDIQDETTWFVSWFNLSHLQSSEGYQYHIDEISSLAVSTSADDKVVIACAADITNITKGTTYHQIPLLLYSTDGGNSFTLIFSEDITYQYLSHTTIASDNGIYIVYQKGDPPSSGIVCLYYPDGVVSSEWMDFIPQTDSYNLLDPFVFSYKNNVFITVEREIDGNHDIILLLSTDQGEHWSTLDVATDPVESERYPSLFFDGSRLFCTFINTTSSNIYLITSDDKGLTWSEAKQVNSEDSSALNAYHSMQLGNNHSVVWADKRGGNLLIYYSNFEEKNLAPQPSDDIDLSITPGSIQIKSVEGKIIKHMNNLVSVVISNQGEKRVENVEVALFIGLKDDSKLTHIASETILSLNAGEEKEVKLLLFSPVVADAAPALIEFAGIDEITVIVDPDNLIYEKDEYNNKASLQCNYGEIFPRFAWLENIILRFLENGGKNNISMLEDTLVQVLQNGDGSRVKLVETLLS
ncbi:MAG TPA: hypothetical protein ENI42_00070 [Thermoplasmatales archaeon]|nr:hypothetical protein [Thermoplasmatales archaeon]